MLVRRASGTRIIGPTPATLTIGCVNVDWLASATTIVRSVRITSADSEPASGTFTSSSPSAPAPSAMMMRSPSPSGTLMVAMSALPSSRACWATNCRAFTRRVAGQQRRRHLANRVQPAFAMSQLRHTAARWRSPRPPGSQGPGPPPRHPR